MAWRRHADQHLYLGAKRLFDIVGGLIGGLAVLALCPLIWLANRVISPGALFYWQERVGQDGRLFPPERALDDEEQFVGIVVVMPDELALEPGELDLLAIQLAHDARAPVVGEEGELLSQVDDFYHRAPSLSFTVSAPVARC